MKFVIKDQQNDNNFTETTSKTTYNFPSFNNNKKINVWLYSYIS
jgi:hypothetical protein